MFHHFCRGRRSFHHALLLSAAGAASSAPQIHFFAWAGSNPVRREVVAQSGRAVIPHPLSNIVLQFQRRMPVELHGSPHGLGSSPTAQPDENPRAQSVPPPLSPSFFINARMQHDHPPLRCHPGRRRSADQAVDARRSAGRRSPQTAAEHRQAALHPPLDRGDARRASGQGGDGGFGGADHRRHRAGGGGRGHRLRHDRGAHHAYRERPAGQSCGNP